MNKRRKGQQIRKNGGAEKNSCEGVKGEGGKEEEWTAEKRGGKRKAERVQLHGITN